MKRIWRVVHLSEAQRHPLYGIKNWLVVHAISIPLAFLWAIFILGGQATSAGVSLDYLLSMDTPAISFVKTTLLLHAVIGIAVYWLLFTKSRKFRLTTSVLYLSSWPATALLAVAIPFPHMATTLIASFFAWAISCAVWVTYINRSRRVRVTFENSVLLSAQDIQIRYSRLKVSDERYWRAALQEFHSPERDQAAWAKAFSEQGGNESAAKAVYLKVRRAQIELENQVAEGHQEGSISNESVREAKRYLESAGYWVEEAGSSSVEKVTSGPELVALAKKVRNGKILHATSRQP